MLANARKVDFFKPINTQFRVPNDYKGEVGIEVEVEGRRLPGAIPSYWDCHKDGSLRGESMEYVLKQPCKRDSVHKFLKYLKAQFERNEAKPDEKSPRTSVHVHINMNDKNLVEAFNVIVMYHIFEDLMTNIAGDKRVGNLFCLRARDAEYFIDVLTAIAKTRKFGLNPEGLRYSSVNICAIEKFNSIEFRALRGTTDPDTINQWVELLLCIKDAALKYANPQEILVDFSRSGPNEFVRKVFGDHAPMFTKQRNYAETMWESARLVQEVAYANEWIDDPDEKPKRVFPVPERARPFADPRDDDF